VQKMLDLNFKSSCTAAFIASKVLNQMGLLTLTGSVASLKETPDMIGYGASKAMVHHLVGSLAKSCVFEGKSVLGVLPRTLSPELNPTDTTAIPMDQVAQMLIEWSVNNSARPITGSLISIENTIFLETSTTVNFAVNHNANEIMQFGSSKSVAAIEKLKIRLDKDNQFSQDLTELFDLWKAKKE